MKILCITGWCRNGSTVLGNVLNEVPGFFHVGELHFLWKNAAGLGANSLCGCGRHLTDCPVWAPIAAGTDATEVIRRQRAFVRTRHTWRVLRRGVTSADMRVHADLLATTLHAAAEATGASVVVDTSKIPGESALLPHLDGIEPYYVHLVRHPAAVALSWQREKDYVWAMSAARSTAYWDGFNLAAHALCRRIPDRSTFLRYEDIAADPAGAVDDLLDLVGADTAANPVRGRTVEMHTNHTVTGNPDRFRTGPVEIRPADYPWRTELSPAAKAAAFGIGLPFAARYGYLGTRRREARSAARA